MHRPKSSFFIVLAAVLLELGLVLCLSVYASGTTVHDVSGVGEPLNFAVADLAAVSWKS